MMGPQDKGSNWASVLEKLCEVLIRSGIQKSDSRWKFQMSCVWLAAPLSCHKKSPEQKNSEENGRNRRWGNQDNCEGLLCYWSIKHRGRQIAINAWAEKRSFMKISNITDCSLWVLWLLLWYWWEIYNSWLMTSLEDFQSLKVFKRTY